MTNTVKSLRRANRLIETLIEVKTANVSELAKRLDMPLSTAYDYVSTLESIDYVTKLPNGRYRVSVHFLEVGNEVRHQYKLYTVAEPELDKIASETGEYAFLMIEEGNLGTILCMKLGEKASPLNIHRTYAGTRTRLNTTATGKAILSKLPKERARSIIDEYGLSSKTENTITEQKKLFEELESIQTTGYAIDDEERFEGMRGIGVPVVSKPDDTVAAIGLYGPTHRFTDTTLHENLSERILELANVIQVSLTYS